MIGKGYVKVSKEYLAESVVTLTTLGEILDCIETSNPAVSSRIQDSLQPGDNAAAIKGARWGLIDGFYHIKKYYSYPKLSHFEILKIQVITVCART